MFVVAAVFSVLFKTLNVKKALPKVSVDSEVHLKFYLKNETNHARLIYFFARKMNIYLNQAHETS